MRNLWMCLPLAVVALAGCLDDDATIDADGDLALYPYNYEGDHVVPKDTRHGWAFLVTNNGDAPADFAIETDGIMEADLGPATTDGWDASLITATHTDLQDQTLAPGASRLYLMQVAQYRRPDNGFNATASVTVGSESWTRVVADDPPTTPVVPGDHVHTITVGLWVNGTSFYTNIAELDADPNFPAGYPGPVDGTPLPIYVYDDANGEQPPRSRDTCHFTTITGYNDLLKSQATYGTGVRYLAPEEAYTRPGAEDFFLYGHPLVFLNTVVAHDGPADDTPIGDPQGDCFDARNSSPVPVPGLPPVPLTDG